MRLSLPGILLAVLLCRTEGEAQDMHRCWIFLAPREAASGQGLNAADLGITERALWRRSKVLPRDHLIDESDLPVSPTFLEDLHSRGIRVHAVSRWLNAVSAELTPEQALQVQRLPYVRGIRKVASARKGIPEVPPATIPPPLRKTMSLDSAAYGLSYRQIENINLLDLHRWGVNGGGVIIGLADDGFNDHTVHPALKGIRVIDEYDFIQRDEDTSRDSTEGATQGNHGTGVLSLLAGFDQGNLIGAAYGAAVILAKTEYIPTETHVEEDYYVEALERMEQLGADIVSTSLGYRDFDSTTWSYSYQDLDGRTTVVARAAGMAARKGVLLVTAMGNEGLQTGSPAVSIPGTITSPADADSILGVGATSSDGVHLMLWSGTGPTADGRIKPDIVAQGSLVWWANTSKSLYGYTAGTSAATPLVAGVAAAVLSAHPNLTPMQLRAAILNTAVQINDGTSMTSLWPNNYYGYGRINGTAAAMSLGLFFGNAPKVTDHDSVLEVSTFVVSSVALVPDSVLLHYRLSASGTWESVVMTPTSTQHEYKALIPKSTDTAYPQGYVSAYNSTDGTRTSPWGAPDSLFFFQSSTTGVPGRAIPLTYELHQNYPNPFNSGTVILVDAPSGETVELSIFNILGQKIATIFRGETQPGLNTFRWEGVDATGAPAATGVYFCRMTTPASVHVTRMVLLR